MESLGRQLHLIWGIGQTWPWLKGDSRAAENGWTFSLLVTPDAPAKTYNVNIVVELASGQKIQLSSVAQNGCEVMIPAVSKPMPKENKPTKK